MNIDGWKRLEEWHHSGFPLNELPPDLELAAIKAALSLRARVAVLEDKLKVEHDVCMAAITVANDSEARIKELEEEAREVCGALGEFYGKGQGTAVEKIRFMREDHATALQRIAELEGQLNEQIVVAGARKAVANNWEDLHAQLEAKLAAADAELTRLLDRLSQTVPRELYDKLRDDIIAAKEAGK